MIYISLFTGVILILLGLSTFFMTGSDSPTALIPVFFGVFYCIAGLISKRERFKKIAMYGTIFLSFLGVTGTMRSIPVFIDFLKGSAPESPLAIFSQLTMLVLCGIFLLLSVRAAYEHFSQIEEDN
ncbi:hypothetical protein AB2B38_012090 [Balneola sp. MJW-20]|uniref:hypothetical protein n=1 Tax=Gracilimonas aurantiaca TaxID=3234185 RepID=UPI0034670E06